MGFVVVAQIKANEREIPGNLPPALWMQKVLEYRYEAETLALPWYRPAMELLQPEELARLRAKARIWLEVTGVFPGDISCWMEIRRARERGDIPPSTEFVTVEIDEEGTLHCGRCGARWSRPHGTSCGLCGVQWIDNREAIEA